MSSVCVCSDFFQVNDDGELCLIPGSTGLQDILTFYPAGNYSFSKADYPNLARVRVRVQGAGGGSAGANAAASECIVRPGGSGGGYSESLIDASVLSASETIIVGAGGVAGVGNSDGGGGGASSFGGFVVAPGGTGGTSAQSSGTAADAVSGVGGPLAGTGDIRMGGGASGSGVRLNGVNGVSGAGGDSYMGTGGFPRASQGAGTSPRGFGGGAGGALSYGNEYDGQAGGDGLVIVELHF